MRLLLDTHVLIWVTAEPDRISNDVLRIIESRDTELVFSAASVWEVAIKRTLGREDFEVDPRLLRRGLMENGYTELAITGAHAAAVDSLPPIHKDPFDRILIAQALAESLMLLTADPVVARYPGPIMSV
ncbi:MAG: type II toxin-antitoxin system VapC family toxin [Bryobacterales bacterium]|nr:type II toxin-antitoxin system VapC family toxin [Bryobacterales bacterium]MDE0262684.1 type II toxin-antitoxin system VapC family toxin [Bryobacterales bacterium]